MNEENEVESTRPCNELFINPVDVRGKRGSPEKRICLFLFVGRGTRPTVLGIMNTFSNVILWF